MIVPRCFLSWRAVPVTGRTTERRDHWHSGAVWWPPKKEDEDRKANYAGLVAAKEEIATLTATVRITLFCSAIVIDVIVRCHTAGALLSQSAENNCPYHRVVVLILSGQFIITLVAELGIQPLIRSFWTETSALELEC